MPERGETTNNNPEQKEARMFLIELARKANFEIPHNEVLDAVEKGGLSSEQWQEFAKQRYLAALPFEDLLKAGIAKAKEIGDLELAETLQSNLNDELGVDENSVQHKEKAHATWRHDFYSALGIDESSLEKSKPLDGTRNYSTVLEDLINRGDVLEISGALFVLEASIPQEFKRIQKGRDKDFSESFVVRQGDSEEVKERKRKARLYIDDHIEHDADSHYPDLLNTLKKYASSEDTLQRV